jgi:hypothetical protein
MSICIGFKFINDSGEPTGYYGFAVANSMVDLFWEIDQYGDPYSVLIKKMKRSSMCVKVDVISDEELDFNQYEVSEDFIGILDDEFIKPEWPENIYGRQ